jgi:hypothetical protein
MTQDLDALLEDALQHIPAKAKKEHTGPALPTRTQHHSPIEAESVFVRYCAWWNEVQCTKCHHSEPSFDGLFEERNWIRPEEHIGGPRHWLACSVAPLPELMKDAVSYVRYYSVNFCSECLGAKAWPLAQAWRDGEPCGKPESNASENVVQGQT